MEKICQSFSEFVQTPNAYKWELFLLMILLENYLVNFYYFFPSCKTVTMAFSGPSTSAQVPLFHQIHLGHGMELQVVAFILPMEVLYVIQNLG